MHTLVTPVVQAQSACALTIRIYSNSQMNTTDNTIYLNRVHTLVMPWLQDLYDLYIDSIFPSNSLYKC